VERIAPAVIARTYYDPDADPHAATPSAMERHLAKMLDTLVQLALAHGSTVLADHLRASIKQHGRPKLTAVTFRMVTEAAHLVPAPPHPDHAIGAWLRPRVARPLKGEGIATLGELVAFSNRRGSSWWRSIPRIGPGRARVIVNWLQRQQAVLGLTVDTDVDSIEREGVPLVAVDLVEVVLNPVSDHEASRGADRLTLTPLERLSVPHALSSADGENRSTAFCYIQAQHDLDAVGAYLNRYRDQPKTLRAYTKELERFLLWAVVLRGKALSDLRVDDCEAYKDFAELALKTCIHHAVMADEWRLDSSQCEVVEAVLRAYDVQLASLPVHTIRSKRRTCAWDGCWRNRGVFRTWLRRKTQALSSEASEVHMSACPPDCAPAIAWAY
jgi:hypothetical protein